MGRFASRLPFSARADFVARKAMTVGGVAYVGCGEPFERTELVTDRLLRRLFEQGKIEVADPDAVKAKGAPGEGTPPVESQACEAGQGEQDGGGAQAPSPDGPAEPEAPAVPPAAEPKVQKQGMGNKWVVIGADGVQVGDSHEGKAAATAALAIYVASRPAA